MGTPAWPDEKVQELRKLWIEGLSTSLIGRQIGLSKNSVVGKAHRLGLDARPSPIKRANAATSLPAIPSVPRPIHTLPPLPTFVEPVAVRVVAFQPEPAPAPQRPVTSLKRDVPTAATSMFTGPVAPRMSLVPPQAPHPSRSSCLWPIGEPGTKTFRFCDAGSLPNKPYCDEHAKLAYVKPRDCWVR
jgi:GcrA cell cycle regulator